MNKGTLRGVPNTPLEPQSVRPKKLDLSGGAITHVFPASGTYDDYQIGGIERATLLRFDTTAGTVTLNGIAGGSDGQLLVLINLGPNTLTLATNQSTSLSKNRIRNPDGGFNHVVNWNSGGLPDFMIYDATSGYWRVFGWRPAAGSHTWEGATTFVTQGVTFTGAMTLDASGTQLKVDAQNNASTSSFGAVRQVLMAWDGTETRWMYEPASTVGNLRMFR